MPKYLVLLTLSVVSASAQNGADVLTNETVIKMVQAGVPAATIIKTIAAAGKVDFRFIGPDLQRLTDTRVPDDVFKAMAAKDKGRPISTSTSTPPSVQPTPAQPPARVEPQKLVTRTDTESVLTNESLVKLVKAGMGDDVILGMVTNQPGQYSVTPDNLIVLKQAGVSDRIIGAIVNRKGAGDYPPVPTTSQSLSSISASEQGSNSAAKPRIFVTDSNSWEISGGFAAASGSNGGAASGRVGGGARPQTVEIIKTFGERCPSATVTMDKVQAQYIILLDHEGGKGYALRDNKIAVFRIGGDLVYSGSTRSLGNAVKDACTAIFR